MNFQAMIKQRRFILISSVAGVIGMFLPWFRFEIFGFSQSINGLHDWGILVFFCFIASGILSFLGDQTKNFNKTVWIIVLILGGAASLIMIFSFLKLLGSGAGFLSIGFYLALLSAIGVVISAYHFRNPSDTIRDGFKSLQNTLQEKAQSDKEV